MGVDQLKELKRLQKENEQLVPAVSDLTLGRLTLKEEAKENYKTRSSSRLHRTPE